ncbi:MAG: flotillin-like protein FloA [Clostridia bacterium]
MSVAFWIILGVIVIAIGVLLALVPMKVFIRALVSGAYVSMTRLVAMRFRHCDVKGIVDQYIVGKKAGLDIDINELETHSMAGGNIENIVSALIAAKSAGLELTNDEAKAIDLAGRDVLSAVRNSVKPEVIMTPEISAVAKDGIELKVKARVTVKTDLKKIIGYAGQETIIARVGEGIVTAVGCADNHKLVMENPDIISGTVIRKGLDQDTAYIIVSLDIADISVGENVDSKLIIDKAEAEKKVAQARAEERRAQAIATEYEMRAKAQEMRAVVLAAESEVPKAIAAAFKQGKLGVMDYYRMQNMVADTNMRNSLTKNEDKGTPTEEF